jgi:hypothetical protein
MTRKKIFQQGPGYTVYCAGDSRAVSDRVALHEFAGESTADFAQHRDAWETSNGIGPLSWGSLSRTVKVTRRIVVSTGSRVVPGVNDEDRHSAKPSLAQSL